MSIDNRRVRSAARVKHLGLIHESLQDEDMENMWSMVCERIVITLRIGRGISIPYFGTFTLSNSTALTLPLFIPNLAFLSRLSLRSTPTSATHHSSRAPVRALNYATLAHGTRYSREMFRLSVERSVEAVNRVVEMKGRLRLDFKSLGVLKVESSRVEFIFAKNLVRELRGVDGITQQRAFGGKETAEVKGQDSIKADEWEGESISNASITVESREKIITTKLAEADLITKNDFSIASKSDCKPLPMDDRLDLLIKRPSSGNRPFTANGKPSVKRQSSTNSQSVKSCSLIRRSYSIPSLKSFAGIGRPDVECLTNHQRWTQSFTPESHKTMGLSWNGPPSFRRPDIRPSKAIQGKDEAIFSARDNEIHVGNDDRFYASAPAGHLNTSDYLVSVDSNSFEAGEAIPRSRTPSCNHRLAWGQEFCYMCFQRNARNVFVSNDEMRRREEREENLVLQQLQNEMDRRAAEAERQKDADQRQRARCVAAFNLRIAERRDANEKFEKEEAFFRDAEAFVLCDRPPTTELRDAKAEEQPRLAVQTRLKEQEKEKREERDRRTKLEQELAEERAEGWRRKRREEEDYRTQLAAQIESRPSPPFHSVNAIDTYFRHEDADAVLAETRRRKEALTADQRRSAEEAKAAAKLRLLDEAAKDAECLTRIKEELKRDRNARRRKEVANRAALESTWRQQAAEKTNRDAEKRSHESAADGGLVHEQCDVYRRCHRCQRQLANAGESNVWRESYFVAGTRFFV